MGAALLAHPGSDGIRQLGITIQVSIAAECSALVPWTQRLCSPSYDLRHLKGPSSLAGTLEIFQQRGQGMGP